MPHLRPDLEGLLTYVPGRPIEEVAREIGMNPDEIVKLASNESPEGPFPGVREAVMAATVESNRYPDSDVYELTREMASHLGLTPGQVWFGAGSTGLLGAIALGAGGAGTSALYAWPSFVMYRIISRWAGTEAIEIPLDDGHRHDLPRMLSSLEPTTTVVYLCNPNNPTGTIVGGDEVRAFIESVPESALVVVDEAYHDFVEDPSYRSMADLAPHRPNLVVLRTFSKIYALASHRVGYAVGEEGLLERLRRTQAPFTVSSVAQAAARASLGNESERVRRAQANAAGRRHLLGALDERGLARTDSQTNFVYFQLGDDGRLAAAEFTKRGVIVRPMSGGWVRVTVGTDEENHRFISALDDVVSVISN